MYEPLGMKKVVNYTKTVFVCTHSLGTLPLIYISYQIRFKNFRQSLDSLNQDIQNLSVV